MRKEKVRSVAAAPSLAEHLLDISLKKWEAGRPEEELNLERYGGWVPMRVPLTGEVVTDPETGLPILERTPQSMFDGWLQFCEEVLGFRPRGYQAEIARRLLASRRLCVRAPRRAGKSAAVATLVIWFLTVHSVCKIPTSAGSWAQLEEFLWPEIHLWAGKADWTLVGKRPKMNLLDMSFGSSDDGLVKATARAFAIRSDEPEKMEGAHSENVLLILDEAKAIEDPTYDAVEGTLAFANTFFLVVSTPGAPIGRFYDIQMRKPGYHDWDAMRITKEDMIEALEGEKREAYIKWCNDRLAQWGADSPMYRNHVLGEFADTSDTAIIPLEWVEAAQERWRLWKQAGCPEQWVQNPRIRTLGVDVAGQGKDNTCIAQRWGNAIFDIRRDHRADTMQTANRVMAMTGNWPVVHIETDGMGVGPYDRMREIVSEDSEENQPKYSGVKIQSIISGSKSEAKDKSGELGFYDYRSYMWWHMREILEPGSGHDIMLPDDPLLTADLTTPMWELRGDKIKVEKKDEIRKRLKGRSTDCGDAVIIAFAEDTAPVVVSHVRVETSLEDRPGTFYDHQTPRQWPGYVGRY